MLTSDVKLPSLQNDVPSKAPIDSGPLVHIEKTSDDEEIEVDIDGDDDDDIDEHNIDTGD